MIFRPGSILLLRYRQMLRISYQLGIMRLLPVLGVIVYAIVATCLLIAAEKNVCLIASFYLLLCLIVHLRRKDKIFLKLNISPVKIVYSVEYLIFLLPLIICLLLYGKWLVLLYVAVGTLFISSFDYRTGINSKSLKIHQSFHAKVQKLIPFDLYEWKAGIRKNFIFLLIIYGLGICLSYFVVAIPVAMLIVGLVISEFFIPDESWQMLLSFEKSPGPK